MPGIASSENTHGTDVVPAKAAAAQDALRDLWIGHIFWVRNVVAARLAENAGQAEQAEQQVVTNAQAIAGAIAPYYGEAASAGLFELLAGHWGAIDAYLDATLADNNSKQNAAAKRLAENADAIARFLSGANPNWPVDTLRGLLAAHGAHHVQQIEQLAANQYAQETLTWTAMKNHMYVIADALAAGIAKQFPEKFE
jgi:hypothetical protein